MDPLARPDATQPSATDLAEELLGRCLQHPPERWRQALDAVCAAHPEAAPAVRARFAAIEDLGFEAPAARTSMVAWGAEDPDLMRDLAAALECDQAALDGARADAAGATLTGRVLDGRYRLERRLGGGGMGAVYAGTDLELERAVAVKVLHPALFDDAASQQRFEREAELLAQLSHPHVVRLYDRGRGADGERFSVMELLRGAPLDALLAASASRGAPGIDPTVAEELLGASMAERSPLRLGVAWIADVAAGLGAAHAAGVLHRDLKPSNIFIRTDGTAVLVDFGIAARRDQAALTAPDHVVGTPSYMAPEQAAGQARGATLDVYGLTACLYNVITHRSPFEGTVLEVLEALRHATPARAAQIVPGLARDLGAVVEHGMEREPRHRYPTVAALERDLRAFLDHRPVTARPLTPVQRGWRRLGRVRSKGAIAVAGIATAALVAIGVGAVLDQRVAARQARVAEHFRHLPPALALQGSPVQRTAPAWRARRAPHVERLGQILALDPAQPHARVLRAALRLDDGQREAAAADLAALADHNGSAFFAAAAAQLRDAGTRPPHLDALAVAGTSATEQYAEALFKLRGRRPEQRAAALQALRTAATADQHAAELALLYAEDEAERLQRAEELERALGGTTARTCYARGLAHLRLRHLPEAAEAFRASAQLCERQYNAHHNLGVTYRFMGRWDEAAAALDRARAYWPENWRTPHVLSQVAQARGDFAAALALAAELPDDTPAAAVTRLERMAVVRIQEALAARRGRDGEQARALATAALEYLRTATQAAPRRRDLRLRLRRNAEVARHLAEDGSVDDAFLSYSGSLVDGPGSAAEISIRSADVWNNLAELLPSDPSPEALDTVRLLFRRRAEELAAPRK
ncbi:MAG: serine/threonine-protein kinase [Planctomycetota bacterium]